MPKFDPQKPFDVAQGRHHRRSIRLQGYDYSQVGGYFVTIVTWHRECLFGVVVNGEIMLNRRGQIADECWQDISNHFPYVELGSYIIMPNHMHGIIVINDDRRGTMDVGATHASPLQTRPRGVLPGSLGAIIGSYKSAVTKRIGREMNETGIWQRNYYEHIIRDDKDLRNKTEYILANPQLWEEDDENPGNGNNL